MKCWRKPWQTANPVHQPLVPLGGAQLSSPAGPAEAHLEGHRDTKSRMSSTAPTTDASRDLIQELSWQKLQYCTMVMRMAQHMNMVYCKERDRG